MRPDIRYGLVPTSVNSPQPPAPPAPPPAPPSASPPLAAQPQVDYSSPFLCKLDLSSLRPAAASGRGESPHKEGPGSVDESGVIDVGEEVGST